MQVWDGGWHTGGPVPCWHRAAAVSKELQAAGWAKRQISAHVKPVAAFPVRMGFLEVKVMDTSSVLVST